MKFESDTILRKEASINANNQALSTVALGQIPDLLTTAYDAYRYDNKPLSLHLWDLNQFAARLPTTLAVLRTDENNHIEPSTLTRSIEALDLNEQARLVKLLIKKGQQDGMIGDQMAQVMDKIYDGQYDALCSPWTTLYSLGSKGHLPPDFISNFDERVSAKLQQTELDKYMKATEMMFRMGFAAIPLDTSLAMTIILVSGTLAMTEGRRRKWIHNIMGMSPEMALTLGKAIVGFSPLVAPKASCVNPEDVTRFSKRRNIQLEYDEETAQTTYEIVEKLHLLGNKGIEIGNIVRNAKPLFQDKLTEVDQMGIRQYGVSEDNMPVIWDALRERNALEYELAQHNMRKCTLQAVGYLKNT